jgi:hypothetical protein
MDTPDLKLIHKDSPMSDLLLHLRFIIDHVNPSTSRLVFYDQIASFYSGKEKANSVSGWPGHANNKTFSDFLNSRLDGASARVGLFTTFIESWVGYGEAGWRKMSMHAWIGILVTGRRGKGKILVFWDPNGDEYLKRAANTPNGVTWKNTLAAGQKRLLEKCKERRHKVEEVWLGGSGNKGQTKCLRLSLTWMRWLAAEGDLEVERLEQMGFTRL